MDHSNGICMGCMNEIGNQQICPSCGFDNSASDNGCGLPLRTLLAGRYIVGKVLESGGDGITYIGKEISSGKSVRIREFFPQSICQRNADGSVSTQTENAFSYNESLINFIELARSLAAFAGSPNLLDVIDIFEAGGTAYYVTENISAITLREFLMRNGGQLTWEQVRSLIVPVMQTITALHERGIIHRGISPETLLVGRDGKVRLVGFCIEAARMEKGSEIPARLFPGFAAIEQYGFDANPGPWTDVYSLAATLFRTLIGNPPPEATERIANDSMAIPSKLAGEIPKNVLSALAGALQIMPQNRTKSMEEFRSGLLTDSKAAAVAAINAEKEEKKNNTFFKKYGVLVFAGIAVVLLAVIAAIVISSLNGSDGDDSSEESDLSVEISSELILNEEQEPIKTENFIGKTESFVKEFLEEQEIEGVTVVVVEEEFNDKYARGQIYKQEPAEGENLTKTLQIYISRGPKEITLPDFVKDKTDYKDAQIKLLEMGIYPDNIEFDATSKLGMETNVIYEMEPKAGTKISFNDKVVLKYYREVGDIEVIDFTKYNYYTQIEGRRDFADYNFEIEGEYFENAARYPKGKVISQSIPAGTTISNTDTIVLKISLGVPPSMPNLSGYLKSDAKAILNDLGIDNISIVEQYHSTIAPGKVISTNPSVGVAITGPVTLYISRGERPVASVPDDVSSQAPVTSVIPSEPEEITSSEPDTSSDIESSSSESVVTSSESEIVE